MAASVRLDGTPAGLIPRLAAPTLVGLTASSLSQLVNVCFVTGLGVDATAAVALVLPLTLALLLPVLRGPRRG